MEQRIEARLIITADDYGLAPAYDAGILEVARAGAVDAASALVVGELDPKPLLECGIELGLHLALPVEPARAIEIAVDDQLRRFVERCGGPPAYIDGHHHCHATPGPSALCVARLGLRLGLPVRSVDPGHRRLLRSLGVATADRLVGRMSEDEPALPAQIAAWIEHGDAPAGVTEWMVHPGQAGGGSSYDRGRQEDLELLLELGGRRRWRGRGVERGGPAAALGSGGAR